MAMELTLILIFFLLLFGFLFTLRKRFLVYFLLLLIFREKMFPAIVNFKFSPVFSCLKDKVVGVLSSLINNNAEYKHFHPFIRQPNKIFLLRQKFINLVSQNQGTAQDLQKLK